MIDIAKCYHLFKKRMNSVRSKSEYYIEQCNLLTFVSALALDKQA